MKELEQHTHTHPLEADLVEDAINNLDDDGQTRKRYKSMFCFLSFFVVF